MTNFVGKIRRKIGKSLKRLGDKLCHEPNIPKLDPIKAIYVPDDYERIMVQKVSMRNFEELDDPNFRYEEAEEQEMAIELSRKLLPYVKKRVDWVDGVVTKRLTVYVEKNGEA